MLIYENSTLDEVLPNRLFYSLKDHAIVLFISIKFSKTIVENATFLANRICLGLFTILGLYVSWSLRRA